MWIRHFMTEADYQLIWWIQRQRFFYSIGLYALQLWRATVAVSNQFINYIDMMIERHGSSKMVWLLILLFLREFGLIFKWAVIYSFVADPSLNNGFVRHEVRQTLYIYLIIIAINTLGVMADLLARIYGFVKLSSS